MRCSCGGEAEVEVRRIKKIFCRECFCNWFEQRFLETIEKNKLIEKGEKIAVAVSGGKDSLTLLFLMNRFLGESNEIVCLTLDEGIKGYRDRTIERVEHYCREWGIELFLFSFEKELGITIDKVSAALESPCFACGVFRRYLLNKKAREIGAQKLATAHNLDDEAQSVVMNLFRKDIPKLVRLKAFAGIEEHELLVPRIKPFRYLREREIMAYFLLHGFETAWVECPYVERSYRHEIRQRLYSIEEAMPGATEALVLFFDEKVKEIEVKRELRRCELCGEVTSERICRTCELLNEVKGKVQGRA